MNTLFRHLWKLFGLTFFMLIPLCASQPLTQQAPADVDISEFDFKFDPNEFAFDDSFTESAAPQGQEIDVHLPFIGDRKLVPFTDPATGKPGYKLTVTDKAKLPKLGNFTIEGLEITFIGNVMNITGRLSIFGKIGQFTASDITFSNKELPLPGTSGSIKNTVTKMTLNATFPKKPTLTISRGKTITLDSVTIKLERGEPVIAKAHTSIINRPLIVGFAFTKNTVSAFLKLPSDTPLSTLAPTIADTPLKTALIREAKLKINNIYAKKVPQSTQEENDEERIARQEEEEARQLNASITGLVTYNSSTLTESLADDFDEAINPSQFSLAGTLSGKGIDFDLQAKNVPIKGLGSLETAKLEINTTAAPSVIKLSGSLLIQLPSINNLTASTTITITKEGIEVSGDVQKDIVYAGIVLKGAHVGIDSKTRKFAITGNASIHDILFQVGLSRGRNPKEPSQAMTVLHAQAQIPAFAPFPSTPGLNTIKVTNLTAGLKAIKTTKGTSLEPIIGGRLSLFGMDFATTIRWVENAGGQKGIYINMPVTENANLGSLIPGMNKKPFTEIILKEAAFQACSIEFEDTESGKTIAKGLSLLAHVPLSGPLKKAAEVTGSKDQDFMIRGTLSMSNPLDNEFSILLSRGDPDQTKKISLGEMALSISGKPSISIGAQIIFRPGGDQGPLEFRGKFDVSTDATAPTPPTTTLSAAMHGAWNNAFGRKGWIVEDVGLLIGMIVGSPGLPTQLGGTAHLKIKEYLDLRLAFMVSADIKKIAFEGESKEDISLSNAIKLVGEIIDKPIPITNIPALSLKKNALIKYASTTVTIGPKTITPGLAAKADIDILGQEAHLDIFVGCDDLTKCGFKAYASMDPLNIKNVIRITGYEDKETGVKIDKPKLDIEFTLQRQIVHLSGLLNIAEIIQSKTFLEFSDKGIAFDFEEAFGGDKITWTDSDGKKTPLLYARVKGRSSGTIKDPDFTLDIVFKQYLMRYLVWIIRKKVEEAKKEVREGINKAQKEIDKIDNVIADMNKKIESARADVKEAKADYGRRIDDVRELQKQFDQAAKDTQAIDKKIHDLKEWYNALPASDPSKELVYFFNVVDTARYDLFNDTPFNVYARWEFIGDYFRRDIAPQKWVGIKSGLLHKGFSTVFLRNIKVGQVWGKNPETGADLVFTQPMINAKGECPGFENEIFHSTGQAIDHKFRLTIRPKKNPKDNNNWWPSIDISRINRDLVLASKGSKAGEYAAKLAALETEKFVIQTTFKGLRDTLDIATKTQKGFEGIIDVGDKFLKDFVQPGGKAILKGSAITSKGILEGVKQTTIGIMDAGKEIITRPLELFDINEIYYHGSLHDLKDGVLGDVKVVGVIASQPFKFSVTIEPKKGFENLAHVMEDLAKKIGNDIKEKIFDPITKKLKHQSKEIEKEIKVAEQEVPVATPGP